MSHLYIEVKYLPRTGRLRARGGFAGYQSLRCGIYKTVYVKVGSGEPRTMEKSAVEKWMDTNYRYLAVIYARLQKTRIDNNTTLYTHMQSVTAYTTYAKRLRAEGKLSEEKKYPIIMRVKHKKRSYDI